MSARADADTRQAALAALRGTARPGLATLERVRGALRGQMAGVDPLTRHEWLDLPAATIERRTVTPLRHARPADWQ